MLSNKILRLKDFANFIDDALLEAIARQTSPPLVLDLGCSRGKISIFIGVICHVIGVDITEKDVRSAKCSAHQQNVPCDFICADATHLPFRKSVFDLVLVLNILHHMDDFSVLAEMRSCLKGGGEALIIEKLGTNPITVLARFAARILPTSILLKFSDVNTISRHFNNFSARTLENAVVANGYKILLKEHHDLFGTFLPLISIIFVRFRRLLYLFLPSLLRIEEKIMKTSLGRMFSSYLLLLVKCQTNTQERVVS